MAISRSPANGPSRREQQHPQYATDRAVLDELMVQAQERPLSEWVLAEVARLRIRYQGFPENLGSAAGFGSNPGTVGPERRRAVRPDSPDPCPRPGVRPQL